MGVGTVYLVGAGPGDPELITVRGVRCLTLADLVLYDSLVHPELLKHAPKEAELRFVGKRGGKPSARQTRINEQMVEAARAGKTVVRLKGGDPYLFGRGSEEAEVLSANNVPFEVVVGVPAPLACAAYAGISLTHRNLASSVAYITATESKEKDRSLHDWERLATGTQTLVIFMGLGRIQHLMELLVEHGRPSSTPAAVVMDASLPTQQTVVGTVSDIADRAASLKTPALIIVGDVVRLRPELRWFDTKPLFGKRILVTRPLEQSESFAADLRREGAEPIVCPTIRIEDPRDKDRLTTAARGLRSYDWVLFTSQNGVHRFMKEVNRQGLDARGFGTARVAVIGPKTLDSLREYGINPDVMPREYVAEALAEAIVQGGDLTGQRFLLPRAEEARDVLPNSLRDAGAHVDVVAAYQSKAPTNEQAEELRKLVVSGGVDVLTFTASSTVKHFHAIMTREETWEDPMANLTIACIGPITAKTAVDAGFRVDITASEYTTEGLVDALKMHFTK